MAAAKKTTAITKPKPKPKSKTVYLVKNPEETKTRRYKRKAKSILASTGIGGAASSMIPMGAGAMGAKLIQKKFGDGTDEMGNWTWKDYLAGALGGVGTSLLARYMFKATPATAQKIMEGAFLILLFKVMTQEVVPMSDTASKYLGADDEGSWDGYDGYDDDDDDDDAVDGLGDMYEASDGRTYAWDGQQWREWGGDVAGPVSPPGHLGGPVSPPGPLGGPIVASNQSRYDRLYSN